MVTFKEGAVSKKGDRLAEIDPILQAAELPALSAIRLEVLDSLR